MNPRPPTFIEMLRSELTRLDDAPDVDPNDPSLRQFKASILLTIAELEVGRSKAA